MRILYGQRGQPVGSIDGDAVFLKDGEQIAQLVHGYLYNADDGEWMGSLVSGVIFSIYGAPQAFTEDCKEVLIPPLEPTLKSSLPLRLKAAGVNVSGLGERRERRPPQFLIDSLGSTAPTRSRDGYFV